jgi:hypothetical protein
MTTIPKDGAASGMECPVCRSQFADHASLEEHIPDCSVSDALDRVTASGLSPKMQLAEIGKLGQIARMFIVAKEYDEATPSERKLMHVCGECCAFVFARQPPSSCTACGKSETMREADDFIGSLLEDGDEVDSTSNRPILN